MPTLTDLIIKISGDGSSFRNDIKENQSEVTRLVENLDRIHDVAATINVDDAESEAKIRALIDDMDRIRNETAVIDVSTMDGQEKLAVLREQLATIRDEIVNVNVSDTDAIYKINVLRAQLNDLTEDRTIKVDADTNQAQEGIGTLGSLIMSILPLASPLAATATAGVMGLAASFTAAGAGAVGFGAVAIPTLTNIFKAQGDITKAQDAYNKATNDKQRQAAMQQMNEAWDHLDSAQKNAFKSLENFKSFWGSFAGSFENPVLQIFTNALKELQTILSDLKPGIQAASGAFEALQYHMDMFLQTDTWKNFVNFINQNALVNIVNFGDAVGNIIAGLMNLLVDFGGVGNDMALGLVNMTEKFQEWTASVGKTQGFKDFVSYVRENGPKILDIIGNFAKTLGNVLVDMAPLGGVMLSFVDSLTKLLAHLSSTNPTLIEFVAGLTSAFGVMNLLKGPMSFFFNFEKFAPMIKAVSLALLEMSNAEKVAAAGEALMDALNPVGWIALAVAAVVGLATVIITHWTQIKKVTSEVWGGIKDFFVKMWNDIVAFFQSALPILVDVIIGPIGMLVIEIIKHWTEIKNGTSKVFNEIVSWVKNLWSGFKTWISGAAHALAEDVVAAFLWLYNHNYYFKNLVDGIRKVWGTARHDATAAWNGIKGFFSSTWGSISSHAHSVFSGISSYLSSSWSSVRSHASSYWSSIRGTISNYANSARSSVHTHLGPLTSYLSGVWSKIHSRVSSGWSSIQSSLSSRARSAASSVKHYLGNLGSDAYSWGKNMLHGFVSGIEAMIGRVRSAASKVTSAVAKFLGFHSPSEEGEGRNIVIWGHNMIKGFTDGIDAAVPHLRDTMNKVIQAPSLVVGSRVAQMVGSVAGSSGVGNSNVTHNWNLNIQNANMNSQKDIENLAYQLQRFQNNKLGSVGGL
jgi:phage-related protein